ncbi:hypothetical protein [Sporomusa sp.]|uniref:hypothetical protein n=1 Tax=Sporomusa sp. TaxID=2078658 RepID=UPI002C44CABC|nr:hypothetical protein [Sporomusa sp.]HWR08213.1 hypothetical protein [Sporomusa sp.]
MNVIVPKCPHCSELLTGLAENHPEIPHLYALLAMKYDNGKYVLEIGSNTQSMYLRAMVCTKCGHVEFVSAIHQGIVDSKGNAL